MEDNRSMWQKFNDLFDKPPYLGVIVTALVIGGIILFVVL